MIKNQIIKNENLLYECRLCAELGIEHNEWILHLNSLGLTSTSLKKFKNFEIILPLGPLFVGHVLIVPRFHTRSLLTIASDKKRELIRIIRKLRLIFKNLFGGVICFEHGSPNQCDQNISCIEHAHIHIVPFNRPIIPFAKRMLLFRNINFEKIPPKLAENFSYIFVIDITGRHWFCQANMMPSQFMRQMIWIASDKKKGSWDWRVDWKIEAMHDTKTIISPYLYLIDNI